MNLIILLAMSMSFNLYSNVEELSAEFLRKSKVEENILEIRKRISETTTDELVSSLKDDNQKKAFWLNLYNGHVQEMLRKNPKLYEDKNNFFTSKAFSFKDLDLSLDDIENGILRKSQFKYGMGYIKKWFVSSAEKRLQLNQQDWRIHFALNCGASSCPAIQFYESGKIEKQLEKATLGFFEQDVIYDSKKNRVQLSRIFYWFNGDFGGPKGIKEILSKYLNLPLNKNTDLEFKDYDWTIKLD